MTKNLMIVESPAKAKTIEKFLGGDFIVKSCYGHIRDLPKEDTAIDINNNYAPTYEISPDKAALVRELRDIAKNAQEVWLATDEDREGEAISWHLCEALGLNVYTAKRIVFHEITKPAIQKAVANPRKLNLDLVNAQQARRVLDRLVGFEISPILWRKISRNNSLSAGRVQSVAVRLIVEREREIRDFVPVPYFKITAIFKVTDDKGKVSQFKAELPQKIEDGKTAETFLKACIGAKFSVANIQVKPGKRTPPPPFTTSTLQQEASRKLGFSVSRTMSVAQKLYEAGHITYMRTDSTNLSDTALAAAAAQIKSQFGDKYHQQRKYKTKSQGAQEAHEAIRPTYFEHNEAGNTPEEKKLYSLIWKRATASQMADAILEKTIIDIAISTQPKEILVANGEVIKFDGYLALYRESAIDEESEEEQASLLPPMRIGQMVDLKQMAATQKYTRPAARYNEASLVKQLEELGIGRPSTYAPTISTIQQRNYVVRENREGTLRPYQVLTLNGPAESPADHISQKTEQERIGVEKAKLFPTDMGMVVNDFLVKHFKEIVDLHFTAQVEKEFDEIAEGSKEWTAMIDGFYKPFHKTVEFALDHAEREDGQRNLGIDPKTGKVVSARLGKFGPIVQIGDADDPQKKYASLRPPHTIESITIEQALEMFETTLGTDPKTGKVVMARMGKYGPVIQIGDADDADKKYANIRPPYTIDNITLEQALEMFALPRNVGTFEGKEIRANDGRFGPYVQHDGKFVSLPKGGDPLAITLEEAIMLIEAKRVAEASKIIKTFDQAPDIQVLNGRYGPYIKAGDLNVKIPKDADPRELTLAECQALIDQTPPSTKSKGKAKTTAKTTAPKAKTTTASPKKAKTTTTKKTTKG
jgi:DNA topoisomerase-1